MDRVPRRVGRAPCTALPRWSTALPTARWAPPRPRGEGIGAASCAAPRSATSYGVGQPRGRRRSGWCSQRGGWCRTARRAAPVHEEPGEADAGERGGERDSGGWCRRGCHACRSWSLRWWWRGPRPCRGWRRARTCCAPGDGLLNVLLDDFLRVRETRPDLVLDGLELEGELLLHRVARLAEARLDLRLGLVHLLPEQRAALPPAPPSRAPWRRRAARGRRTRSLSSTCWSSTSTLLRTSAGLRRRLEGGQRVPDMVARVASMSRGETGCVVFPRDVTALVSGLVVRAHRTLLLHPAAIVVDRLHCLAGHEVEVPDAPRSPARATSAPMATRDDSRPLLSRREPHGHPGGDSPATRAKARTRTPSEEHASSGCHGHGGARGLCRLLPHLAGCQLHLLAHQRRRRLRQRTEKLADGRLAHSRPPSLLALAGAAVAARAPAALFAGARRAARGGSPRRRVGGLGVPLLRALPATTSRLRRGGGPGALQAPAAKETEHQGAADEERRVATREALHVGHQLGKGALADVPGDGVDALRRLVEVLREGVLVLRRAAARRSCAARWRRP